ncbi:uncharacterized protein LOC120276056 [Dioscorea cayenensis subsp. rotundata]|uniref:Uncharacterized protein LOC120276056 n=1 Tax=Dioscorea cayennensis subsp. rotundata TaxID=55577 RepID=A0AB40CI32_DIOCR|nr:uncharacterized protein LOC120276056 [Dioscorea cayenensis subsp. rotundata]
MANSALSLLLSCRLPSVSMPNFSFRFKRSLNANQRLGIWGKCSIRGPLLSKRLNLVCVRAGEKDLVGSATAEEIVTELDEPPSIESDLEERESSVATILANFTNDFDPYHAAGTPLYQTATFKQRIMGGNESRRFGITNMFKSR